MPTLVKQKQNPKKSAVTKKTQTQKAKAIKRKKNPLQVQKDIKEGTKKTAEKSAPLQPITKIPSPQLQEPSKIIEYGTITIGANPWALVKIDGKNVGNTPLLGKKIPSGKHLIELISPDSETIRYKTEIVLEADQHLRIKAPE